MSSRAPVVVALVAGSHVVNHAFLLLLVPAFGPLRAEFGVSLAALGAVVGVVNAVVTAGQLPLGYVSDSYSHGAVLVGSLAVGSVGAALAAVASSYGVLVGAAAVIGAGVAGHHPAHYPLLSAAVSDTYRSRAYSVHGFAGAVGLAVPFAAVPAAAAAGYGWRAAFGAVAAVGGCYTVAAAVAVRRLPRELTRAGAETNEAGDRRPRALFARLGGYLRSVAGAPLVLLLTALWFVNSAAVWGVRTYAATALDAGYGLEAETASLVAGAMLAVGAVVMLAGGSLGDRLGPTPLLYVGYGSLVVLAAAVGSGRLPVVGAVGVVVLLAATIDLSRPARAALTDVASARGDVGKNFALMTVGISAAGAAAPPLYGYVIDAAGVETAFLAVAATAAVALGLSVAVARAAG